MIFSSFNFLVREGNFEVRKLDLTGDKFGRWKVEKEHGRTKNGHVAWYCKCECGNFRIVSSDQLILGSSKSCGCLSSDLAAIRATTHDMTNTPLFKIWMGMKTRCYNKNVIAYPNYGGRGIKVCDRWLNSFQNFYDDMGDTYKKGLTIERVDVDKNYDPSNCIWIERKLQSRNRTNTIWVETLKGKMTISEAANLAGVSWFCMYNRAKRKCSIEKLLLPPNKAGRSFTNASN